MSWAPGLATGERPSVAKQKRLELLTLLAQILPGGLARPHQIADRLMHRVRNPDPLELSCPQEPSQTGGVASVRLDVLARMAASRRFVLTCSPGRLGISEGATTSQAWPSAKSWRWSP